VFIKKGREKKLHDSLRQSIVTLKNQGHWGRKKGLREIQRAPLGSDDTMQKEKRHRGASEGKENCPLRKKDQLMQGEGTFPKISDPEFRARGNRPKERERSASKGSL